MNEVMKWEPASTIAQGLTLPKIDRHAQDAIRTANKEFEKIEKKASIPLTVTEISQTGY